MSDNEIRDSLASPDGDGWIRTARITDISADGTVTINFGTGDIPATLVASNYTPVLGDAVQVQRRDKSSWLVMFGTRTFNVTTQKISWSTAVPYNVLPNPSSGGGTPSSGSLNIGTDSTGSWRSADGWSQVPPYQGAFSSSRGLWRGCYFYDDGLDPLAGRICTSISIRLHRHNGAGAGGVGSGASVPQWLALHPYRNQPGTAPTFTTQAINVGSLSDATNTLTFPLPVSWGQALIDGRAAGIGHVAGSVKDYSRCKSLAEDSLTGRLTIGWSS